MKRGGQLGLALAAGVALFGVAFSVSRRTLSRDVVSLDLGYARAAFDSSGFLTLRRGSRVVMSGGVVELAYQAGGAGELPLALKDGHSDTVVSWTGSSRTADIEIEYRFESDRPVMTVCWRSSYKAADLIDHERVLFHLPSSTVYGFDRESRWERLSGRHWFTEFVKPYVSLGRGRRSVHLTGHNTFTLTRLDIAGNGTELSLFADSHEAHPFVAFDKRRARRKRSDNTIMSSQHAVPDLKRIHEASFWLGPQPRLFRAQLQPDGRRACLIFSEHADQSRLEANLALYFGTSDTEADDFGKKGLIGHGLRVSKTFFYTQLQDPKLKAAADKLYALGIEIGPHSMRKHTDGELLDVGLRFFEKHYQTRSWVDHGAISGPGTDSSNEEDLAVLGWNRESPHYLLERLERHHYDYAWCYYEQDWMIEPENGLSFNLLYGSRTLVPPWRDVLGRRRKPGHEIVPRLLMYNNRLDHDPLDDKRLWLFATYPHSLCKKSRDFSFLYNQRMIDGLVDARGIHVAHCYLAGRMNESRLYHRRGATWQIDPKFDSRLANMGRHVRAGDLWNPTISQWGDYLTRTLPAVRIRQLAPDACRVTNAGSEAATGFTLAVKLPAEQSVVGSKALRQKQVDDDLMVSMDLDPSESIDVRVEDGPVPATEL